MLEHNQALGELYTQYKATRSHLKGRGGENLYSQIVDIIRNQPGIYPLTRLTFGPANSEVGFQYGFKYSLKGDTFDIDYWSYNRWGILVQKKNRDDHPEIEIVGHETSGPLLHLPESFLIPVGPVHFEDESLPMTQKDIDAARAQALRMAKAAGIKVSKESLEIADRMGSTRKYPDRYFYWQPELSNTPTLISIDFDSLNSYSMALSFKNASIVRNTTIIQEEE